MTIDAADRMTLDEMVQMLKTGAEHYMKSAGYVGTMFAVFHGRGADLIPADFQSERSKDAAEAAIRLHVKHTRAYAVGLVSEAYMVVGEGEKDLVRLSAGLVEDHPDRVEIVNVMVEERSGMWRMSVAPILRESPGDESTPGTMEAWTEAPGKQMEGRFVGWFPHEGSASQRS